MWKEEDREKRHSGEKQQDLLEDEVEKKNVGVPCGCLGLWWTHSLIKDMWAGNIFTGKWWGAFSTSSSHVLLHLDFLFQSKTLILCHFKGPAASIQRVTKTSNVLAGFRISIGTKWGTRSPVTLLLSCNLGIISSWLWSLLAHVQEEAEHLLRLLARLVATWRHSPKPNLCFYFFLLSCQEWELREGNCSKGCSLASVAESKEDLKELCLPTWTI